MKKIIYSGIVALSTIAIVSCSETKKTSTEASTAPTTSASASPTPVSNGEQRMEKDATAPSSAYDFKLTDIDGKPFSLRDFAGKKILVVNTASKCGYTKQYNDLEALYKKYNDKLVVVGFPSGNFMNQEYGDNSEIKEYCKKNHGVTFPLSSKVDVKGKDAIPLFQWLTDATKNGGIDASIGWNFTKFLLDEKGNLIAYFPSKVNPLDEAIVGKL